jgi:hypothetical protein
MIQILLFDAPMSSHRLIGFDMSRLYPIDNGLGRNPAVLARLGNGEYIHWIPSFSDFTKIIENIVFIDIIKNTDCQGKNEKIAFRRSILQAVQCCDGKVLQCCSFAVLQSKQSAAANFVLQLCGWPVAGVHVTTGKFAFRGDFFSF